MRDPTSPPVGLTAASGEAPMAPVRALENDAGEADEAGGVGGGGGAKARLISEMRERTESTDTPSYSPPRNRPLALSAVLCDSVAKRKGRPDWPPFPSIRPSRACAPAGYVSE